MHAGTGLFESHPAPTLLFIQHLHQVSPLPGGRLLKLRMEEAMLFLLPLPGSHVAYISKQ